MRPKGSYYLLFELYTFKQFKLSEYSLKYKKTLAAVSRNELYPRRKALLRSISLFLPERPAELIVVHVRLGLSFAPPACHLVGVGELELPIGAFPRDARRVRRIVEQLEQELPQLDLAAALRHQSAGGGVQQLVGVCWKRETIFCERFSGKVLSRSRANK